MWVTIILDSSINVTPQHVNKKVRGNVVIREANKFLQIAQLEVLTRIKELSALRPTQTLEDLIEVVISEIDFDLDSLDRL